jgi:hypothetical protein
LNLFASSDLDFKYNFHRQAKQTFVINFKLPASLSTNPVLGSQNLEAILAQPRGVRTLQQKAAQGKLPLPPVTS